MGGGEMVEEGAGHTKAHFISLRRAALERFINRVALHPVLRYTRYLKYDKINCFSFNAFQT